MTSEKKNKTGFVKAYDEHNINLKLIMVRNEMKLNQKRKKKQF